jgi:hypothetical protein
VPVAPAPVAAPVVPAVPTCIPIGSQIGFTGTGIYVDYANIVGGQIPYGQRIGSMGLAIPTSGPYQASGVDGSLTMSLAPINGPAPSIYPGYPQYSFCGGTQNCNFLPGQGPGSANIAGSITISPQTQQEINMYFGNGYNGFQNGFYYPGQIAPAPAPAPSTVCVSGIAMDIGHWDNRVYGGNIYLYLNNTQHGFILNF